MENIHSALSKFRMNAVIEKTGVNTYHNNSKYHTIDDLMKGLGSCGDYSLSWYQTFDGNDLVTTIAHLDSGEKIESRVHIGDYNEAQKWAGAVTYKRRICLVTMFGLSEPDADGNETIGTPVKQSKKEPQPERVVSKTADHDYSGPPYRLFHIDGSVRAEFTDIKAWGLALKTALKGNTDSRLSAANKDEVARIEADVTSDAALHHKTKEALIKSLNGLKLEMADA